MKRHAGTRRGALVVAPLLAAGLALMCATTSAADLGSRQQSLQQSVAADNGRIAAYSGRLGDLQARLDGIQSAVDVQRQLLLRIQSQLATAKSRLALLRIDLVRDRRALAAQLVAQYESPSPDIVGVAVNSQGFSDLLDRMDQLRRIARQNAAAVDQVARDKTQVGAEAVRLAGAQKRQQRVTAAVLVERDQIASLRLTVLQQQQGVLADKNRKEAALRQVQRQLAAQAAAAQRSSFASGGAPLAGGSGGGDYGFFPAPGTNYSVGDEPAIAARLDRLGKALQLHLIGLSGYRSPQHSVEVGGFANDPHTSGAASDTPGVEGVPEATLLQFGLTRPFPGAAEADHIQLA